METSFPNIENSTEIATSSSILQSMSTTSTVLVIKPSPSATDTSPSSSSSPVNLVQQNGQINQQGETNKSMSMADADASTSATSVTSALEIAKSSIEGEESQTLTITHTTTSKMISVSVTEVVSVAAVVSTTEAKISPSTMTNSEVMESSSSSMEGNMDESTSSLIQPSKSSEATDVALTSSSVMVQPPKKDAEPLSLCNNYRTIISDETLSLANVLATLSCELKYQPAVRFLSNGNNNLRIKEGCTLDDQFTKTCSRFDTNVWLNGSHPTVSGLTAMEVCVKSSEKSAAALFDQGYCTCERKNVFFVELCNGDGGSDTGNEGGEFYVYRLFPLFKSQGNLKDAKDCVLDYCTEHQPGNPHLSTYSVCLASWLRV